METQLKVGIIGAGRAGMELHFNAYRAIPGVKVTALIETDTEKGKQLAASKGIPAVYPTLEEALKHETFDIVSVCSPPETHFGLASVLAKNGVNILLEKPIFNTLEEADQFAELLKKYPVKFSAIHQKKFNPGITRAIELSRSGEIGEIHKLDVIWMLDGSENKMTYDPDFWCHKLPGGRWQEMIAHQLYQAYHLVGELTLDHISIRNLKNRYSWLPGDEVEVIYKAPKAYVTIKLSVNNEKSGYLHMMVYGAKKILVVNNFKAVDLDKAFLTPSPTFRSSVGFIVRTLLAAVKPKKKPTAAGGQIPKSEHFQNVAGFVEYVKGVKPEPPVSWQEAYYIHQLVLEFGAAIQKLAGK